MRNKNKILLASLFCFSTFFNEVKSSENFRILIQTGLLFCEICCSILILRLTANNQTTQQNVPAQQAEEVEQQNIELEQFPPQSEEMI